MASVELRPSNREAPESIPPLEPGDRLSRDEFERRYAAMPKHIKAELIGGMVYMASPVRQPEHSGPHARVLAWLGLYESLTPGVDYGDNGTVRLDEDSEPQPDAVLFIKHAHGGQSRIDEQGYIEGAPEFVAEIASSSVSYDLHDKLAKYLAAGVREYFVWRVIDSAVDWFGLASGRFVPLERDEQGVIRSRVFPGLWLDGPALLRRDMQTVFKCLNQGLATSEHAEFVARLSK